MSHLLWASVRFSRTNQCVARTALAPRHGEQALREQLARRLRRRTPELEAALRARLTGIAGPGVGWPPEDLRAVAAEAVAFAVASFEAGGEPPPVPRAALQQTRRAAALGIGLGTVMRCCIAGEQMLAELIDDEAEALGEAARETAAATHGEAADALVDAISAAFVEESERLRRSPSRRRTELVRALLAGAPGADPGELGFPLDRWHLGLVVDGPDPAPAITALAARVDRQALLVSGAEREAWVWLSGQEPPVVSAVEALAATLPAELALAVGEPRHGLDGWRQSHREAEAAATVMRAQGQRIVRGKEVQLLAAALRDETLADALLGTYLTPFGGRGERGAVSRQTLRAYLESGCNAVAAAAVLRVNRHTVRRRLRQIEEALGGPLHRWQAELQVALDLEELGG